MKMPRYRMILDWVTVCWVVGEMKGWMVETGLLLIWGLEHGAKEISPDRM